MDIKKINQIESIDGRGMSATDTDAISQYIKEKKSSVLKVQETPLVYTIARSPENACNVGK